MPKVVGPETTVVTVGELEAKAAGESVDRARAMGSYNIGSAEWEDNYRAGLQDVATVINHVLESVFLSHYGRLPDNPEVSDRPRVIAAILDASLGPLRELAVERLSQDICGPGYPR